ncbi:MAG: hypothetical protein U0V74_03710 [Chitinophagales bacterium]
MQNNPDKTAIDSRALVLGPLVSILFTGFYFAAGAFMQSNITPVESFGQHSVFLLPVPLAVFIGILLLAEPVLLYQRIGYENYRNTTVLHIPSAYLILSSIIRIFIRIVITIALLESCGIEIQNGGVWAFSVLTYFFLAEVFLGFIISEKKDRLKLKPKIALEITAQLCSIILLALIAAYFERTYVKELLVDSSLSLPARVAVATLLFLLLYLPNRIIDFYIGWIQQITLQQKLLYLSSILLAFALIIGASFRAP